VREAMSVNSLDQSQRTGDTASVGEQPSDKPKVLNYIVELKSICKSFDDGRNEHQIEVLKDFDFAIDQTAAGSFVVLLGPSGCGKSTILSLISGLLLPDRGEVRVLGDSVTGPSPNSATVLQAYTCFPWLTVLQNVEFGLKLQGKNKKTRKAMAMEYLSKVGLQDRYDAYPKNLSGGMQQRVAIARTLAIKPPIVLMDEPFGALDAQTRFEMQQMLVQLWQQEKNTIIFVTHDINEALLLGDRVVVFRCRPLERKQYSERNIEAVLPRYQRTSDITRSREFSDLSHELREMLRQNRSDNRPS
jgi:NitT/TauT family transport system ATP-binding protein